MQKEKRQRAPKGYRIERWADGIYHVYCGGSCIEETFTRRKAVLVAKRHAAEHGFAGGQGYPSPAVLEREGPAFNPYKGTPK